MPAMGVSVEGGEQSESVRSYKEAVDIQFAERDFELELDRRSWPNASDRPDGWMGEEGSGYLFREITDCKGESLSTPLKESILRFPSAPIHGIHRVHQYHLDEWESENLHTYRVLTRSGPSAPVRRIFLLHNGLNETHTLGLYYRLASYLIAQDEVAGETACLLRPFPGHLTRSRFPRFAETPLDHYLWDGSHLFRQFLRYMIETQWLLSVIARRSAYRCTSGLNLLAEGVDPERSRLDDDCLAASMKQAWTDLYNASDKTVTTLADQGEKVVPLKPTLAEEDDQPFLDAIASLRSLLKLSDRKFSGDLKSGDGENDPPVHVIGYSLGGFTAQSVFMAWPFLVSSCSTLLSGGALRELAPTAFADPEEWQTVLHSLRYELDDAMMGQRFRSGDDSVAGIELELFLFLKRTFYEVFQQEYRGSFQTRLAAFRRRMLFVVGGNDPIVRTQSVLDSGPPDGINMLAIGGLGHFLHGKPQDEEESRQRSFWLPQIGRLIDRLANEAASRQEEERERNWLDSEMNLPPREERYKDQDEIKRVVPTRLSVAERLAVDGEGALPGALFQRCLDDLLVRAQADDGLLFVLRNEIPTVLLDDRAIQERAAVLYHNDPSISGYLDGVRARRKIIGKSQKRVCVVLPWNASSIMRMDAHPGHPSQSESAGGQMPERADPKDTWCNFQKIAAEFMGESAPEFIRICDGRKGVDWGGIPKLDNVAGLSAFARKRLGTADQSRQVTPSLPDCWVWMGRKFFTQPGRDDPLTVETGRRYLCNQIPGYLDGSRLEDDLGNDNLRIVTVSRARYNPRFRGRIVADPKMARDLLLHVALCIAISVPFAAYDLERGGLAA
jgi:pimeloyl-ACP methyl ester carboxylesterase